MKRFTSFSLALAGLFALTVSTATAAGVYGPGSTVVGIDVDGLVPDSSFPGAEGPEKIVDQDAATKYLNFGGQGTGVIVTPSITDTIVQSLRFTAGNDAPGRDPLTFEIFGTDDPITSGQNSFGLGETWTSIATGNTGLDPDPGRSTPGTFVDITNAMDFNSYRIDFTNLRDNNTITQVADIQLYDGLGGTGTALLASGDNAVAVTTNGTLDSSFPSGEAPSFALDMDPGTKYLNFGKENAGLIVGDGTPQIVNSLTFTSANDAPERDPLTWDLFGTDDMVTSAENSGGDAESWTLVDSGVTGLSLDRLATAAPQSVNNTTAYGAYRLVFTGLRDAGAANSMQIADVVFNVPEPTSMALALLGLAACGAKRRRS